MMKRIALVGTSSTGKTTVFDLLKTDLLGYVFVNESTRTVKSYGFPINEDGTSETQLAISSFHLEALLRNSDTILDRSYLDLLVYSRHMDISEPTLEFIEDIWEKVQNKYTHYVYFPIEFDAVEDGERSTNEDWRRTIDKEFQNVLGDLDKPYLTVTGSPKQRVNQILEFIK